MAGAMATGTMKRMASRFQTGRVKSGTASQGASKTFCMETRVGPVQFCRVPGSKLAWNAAEVPVASRINAVRYPATMPQRIGIRRNRPVPSSETSTVTTRATPAMMKAVGSGTSHAEPSPVRPEAMCTATGAKTRPITMMTGPVTIGGRILWRMSEPKIRMLKLMMT